MSVLDHISKMNDSVSKMLSWKVEQQREQQLIHDRLEELTETVSQLNSKCGTLTELLDFVVTQHRHLQLRLHQLMTHQNIQVEALPKTPQAARRSQVLDWGPCASKSHITTSNKWLTNSIRLPLTRLSRCLSNI